MSGTGRYLRVKNFWAYQNADVWKKSRVHPPWCKFFVHRDLELDQLPWEARLLWYELLGVATRYANAFLSETQWIANETRMPPSIVRKHLPRLVEGGWLSYSSTGRRSRKILDKALDQKKKEKKKETPLTPLTEISETPEERIRTAALVRASLAVTNGSIVKWARTDGPKLEDGDFFMAIQGVGDAERKRAIRARAEAKHAA